MMDYIVNFHIINGQNITHKEDIVTLENFADEEMRDELIKYYLEDWYCCEFDILYIDEIKELINRDVDVENFECCF